MIDWDAKRLYLLKHPKCEVCGKNPSVDLDHAIILRDKRFKKWVNVPWNLQAACVECNRGKKADQYEERMNALDRRVRLYGATFIRTWLDSAPAGKKKGRDWTEADTRLKVLEN